MEISKPTYQELEKKLKELEIELQALKLEKDVNVYSGKNNLQGKESLYSTIDDVSRFKQVELELIKAKERAEANEIRFKAISEQAMDGISLADLDGNFVYVNQYFCKMLGFSEEELMNMNVQDLKPPTENTSTFDNTKEKGLAFWSYIKLQRKDTSIIYADINGKKIEINNQPFILGIVRDVTEKFEKETELLVTKEHSEKNEKIVKGIIDNLQDAFFQADLNGCFTFVNPTATKMYGYSYDELIGKPAAMLYAEPAERDRLIADLRTHGEISDWNGLALRKDGSVFWVSMNVKFVKDKDGKIIGTEGVVRDISERKHVETLLKEKSNEVEAQNEEYNQINEELCRAKEKAEESEKKFKTIVETIPAAVFIFDVKNTHVYFLNSYFTGLFGYSFEDIPTLDRWYELAYPDEDYRKFVKERSIKNIIKAIDNTVFFSQTYSIVMCKNGSQKHILWQAMLFGDQLFGCGFDLTQIKEFEKDLIKAKEKAEESNRLKSSFLNNMSHEVRTPLNSIVGFSQLLARPNQSPEKISLFTKQIRNSSEQLIGIITDVVEFSQIQTKQVSLKFSTNNCSLFTNKQTREYFAQKAKEKDIALEFEKSCPCFHRQFCTDFEKLNRIVYHLIDNAIKFTRNGSVNISCGLENDTLEIDISDTGIGISEEMQKVIFEPFRQVETGAARNFGGNGLGLALVRSYVELLKGQISVQSELNVGTTFRVSIPVKTDEVVEIEQIKNVKQAAVNTILIVEDEYSNYQYLSALLEETDCKILYAPNGKQAVEMCREKAEIDLIFMDIKMPIMDGITATKLIKEFRKEIPIIAQTAYALETEKETYVGVFDDYITKPIDEETLIAKVRKFAELKVRK
jgi:PAS domain S-box-containing protein